MRLHGLFNGTGMKIFVLLALCGWCLSYADEPAEPAPSGDKETKQPAKEPGPAPKENKELETRGKLREVTVYRDQALVTREVKIPAPTGLREVVVTDLPEYIVPETLYAESSEGVEVRSVRYRVRPVLQDVRDEVRKLDEQIRETQEQVQANARYQQLGQEHKGYLDKLEQFTAPTATVELTKGVLNAETLKALTIFIFTDRKQLADSELKLAHEQRDLNEKLQLLTRQREVLTGGSAKTMREAVVFVNVKAGGGDLRLGYLVAQASWTPSYNVRTDAKRKQVSVEYNASIQQMSGEDWTDVAMTLSTANPSLVAKAPLLDPLMIALGSPAPPAQSAAGAKDYFSAKRELADQLRQADVSRQQKGIAQAMIVNAAPNAGPGDPQVTAEHLNYDTALNKLASESQVLDLVSHGRVSRSGKPGASQATEGVSVSYQISSRTSLPSRDDRQLIQIASLPMKADFYKVAIPVLTSYVYEEAKVTNDGKTVLLAGPVSTYMAGQFVGRSEMPLVSVGESFTVGFGIDSSLRAGRELINKTETIQGGNRVVDFTYQLTVENFGSEATDVRLLDRLPTAKESEIKLTLVSSGKELSDDANYTAERKKGMLRWEVKVPAQAIGPKAHTIEYKLQLEYDKQLAISGLPTKP